MATMSDTSINVIEAKMKADREALIRLRPTRGMGYEKKS